MVLKKAGVLLTVLILVLSVSACKPGKGADGPTATITEGEYSMDKDVLNSTLPDALPSADPINTSCKGNSEPNTLKNTDPFSLKQSAYDYTYAFWPDGFGGKLRDFYIRTGNYGVSLNTEKGYINHLGALKDKVDEKTALDQDNSVIANLPALKMDYSIIIDGQAYPFQRMAAMYSTQGNSIYNRQAESGRYMQHVDLMSMKFTNQEDLPGHLELSCTPEYFGMSFGVYAAKSVQNAVLTYSMTFEDSYDKVTWNGEKTAVTIANADGAGYTFVSADGNTIIEVNDKTVTFTSKPLTLKRNTFTGCNVTVIPSAAATIQDADKITALVNNISITAKQIFPDAGDQPVKLDANNGYYIIDQRDAKAMDGQSLFDGKATDFSGIFSDDLNNMRVTISNTASQPVRIPIQLFRDGNHLASPVIKNSETGEPLGLPVQASVNFHNHEGLDYSDPRNYMTGIWQRYYTMVEVPANSSVTFDYTSTITRWGGVAAVNHQQISLIGWGGYQQWEHSTGAVGASCLCYDIERAWNGSVMADGYPLYVCGLDENGNQYIASNNLGGGDFLFYLTEKGQRIGFEAVKTQYRQNGPNMTETVYSGYTTDGKVKVEISVYNVRDNCATRFTQHFKYTFLEDVTYSRMALYQNAADSYTYSWWTKMAVGNQNGMTGFKIEDKEYNGEFDTPTLGYNNYIGESGMNQLELGKGLWGAFLNAPKNTSTANKVMAVHEYASTLNGKAYAAPALSLRSTNINGNNCIYELNPPKEVGKTIQAGSVIEATVGYILLPVCKEDYFGDSEVMKNLPDSLFNTWQMAYLFATQSATTVSAAIGTVVRNYPAAIAAQGESGVVAEFTINKGIGYVPVSIKNLKTYSNWILQKKVNGTWTDINQSVNGGKDFWQCYYDATTGTYELTFNVEHNGRNDAGEYRLIKA